MAQPVIIEAVRTPIGKRNGWLSGPPGTRPPGRGPGRGGQAGRDRPRVGRAGRRRLRDPGGRAGLQRDPHGLAAGRPALRGGRHHGRLPVRLVAAGQPLRQQPDRRRRRRHGDRLRRRDHEPRPARGQRLGARRGSGHARRPALRHAEPVRGGRAHRQEVRHHPRGRRLASASSRRRRPPGRRPRTASPARSSPSRHRSSARRARGASTPATRWSSPRTRARARRRSRVWPS